MEIYKKKKYDSIMFFVVIIIAHSRTMGESGRQPTLGPWESQIETLGPWESQVETLGPWESQVESPLWGHGREPGYC